MRPLFSNGDSLNASKVLLEMLKNYDVKIRKIYSTLPIIMVSGYASVDNVVKAMRYGAINRR